MLKGAKKKRKRTVNLEFKDQWIAFKNKGKISMPSSTAQTFPGTRKEFRKVPLAQPGWGHPRCTLIFGNGSRLWGEVENSKDTQAGGNTFSNFSRKAKMVPGPPSRLRKFLVVLVVQEALSGSSSPAQELSGPWKGLIIWLEAWPGNWHHHWASVFSDLDSGVLK